MPKKKKKEKHYILKKPSALRRVWKVWAYNIFWTAVFSQLFWGNYTIDELCLELDIFLMSSIYNVRQDFVIMVVLFWFWFRQMFKDANLIRFTY